jgi:hypothetical protein
VVYKRRKQNEDLGVLKVVHGLPPAPQDLSKGKKEYVE